MGNAQSCANPQVIPLYDEEADRTSLLQRHKLLNDIKKPKKLTIPDYKEELKPTTPLLTYTKYKPKRKKRTKYQIYEPNGDITSV